MKVASQGLMALAIFTSAPAFAASIDVVAFKDTFDTLHSNGQSLFGRPSEVGQGWANIGGGISLAANSVVSNEQGNPNLSFKQFRGASDYTLIRGTSDGVEGVSQADRTYTLKLDTFNTSTSDSTVVQVFTGGGSDKDALVAVLGGTWRYYDPAVANWINTGVANGSGDWSNVEVEIRNGPVTGQLFGYDVFDAEVELFLTRGANNSAGALARTSIGSWDVPDVYVESLYRLDFAIQSGSTFYYDNVNFGYVVPEPAALSLMALPAIALLRRRRTF